MRTETITLFQTQPLEVAQLEPFKKCPQLLVQVFSSLHDNIVALQTLLDTLTQALPHAHVIGATTDGEIESGNVYTHSTILSFSDFDATQLESYCVESINAKESASQLVQKLIQPNTKLLITFSDGTTTNGELFLSTIHQDAPSTPIAGGMAGDNATFTQTYIIYGNKILSKGAVAVALNSEVLHVKTDYSFDWQPLGRAMSITKVKNNRVYEIDHIKATEFYGKYLGREIEEALPNIGIEFPLLLKRNNLVYARAAVAKFEDGSLAFAGNLSQGDKVYLGFADIKQLMLNSSKKAQHFDQQNIETFFIYSCMARRRFMQEVIHTEVEPYANIAPTAGFFTYGEFFHQENENYLFNETLTLVALSEDIDKSIPLRHSHVEKNSNDFSRTFRALSHLFKVTQEEYEFNQKLLNTVVETGRIGYFIRDHIHDSIVFSKIAKEIFNLKHFEAKIPNSGYASLMVLLRRYLHPDDRTKVFSILKEATQKQESYELYCRIILPNSDLRHLKLITTLSFSPTGVLDRTIGTIYDLSELKEEQLRHEELSFLVENAINEVFIVDATNLQYIYANTYALKVLDYDLKSLQELDVYDTNPDLTRQKVTEMLELVGKLEVLTSESVHITKHGQRYPVRSQIYHTHYFGKEVYVIFSSDITQEKEKEKAEETLKETLENVLDYSGTYFLLIRKTEIIHANQALLDFLGIKSVPLLKEKYHCVMDVFEEEDDYFSAQQLDGTCVECDCIAHLLEEDVLGIILHAETKQKRVMKLNLNQLPNRDFIISMTDVTEMEQEAKRFEYQANHDKLTGAYNRSYLEFINQKHLDTFNEHKIDCAFILLDIDDFKQINDQYGHLTGDRVLILLSSAIQQKIRRDDIFVRWGGEEFLLLLPQTTKENATITAENLRQEIIKIDIGINQTITGSFGVTACQKNDTKESLFQRLDKALYCAKDAGKNCIEVL